MACDDKTDDDFFKSIESCFQAVKERYSNQLEKYFDVKCYDFEQQFTTYIDYMSGLLEDKRFEPEHYVSMDSNAPRDKDGECIWKRPDLMEKTKQYLLKQVPYYQFCDQCMGTANELTLEGHAAVVV